MTQLLKCGSFLEIPGDSESRHDGEDRGAVCHKAGALRSAVESRLRSAMEYFGSWDSWSIRASRCESYTRPFVSTTAAFRRNTASFARFIGDFRNAVQNSS